MWNLIKNYGKHFKKFSLVTNKFNSKDVDRNESNFNLKKNIKTLMSTIKFDS